MIRQDFSAVSSSSQAIPRYSYQWKTQKFIISTRCPSKPAIGQSLKMWEHILTSLSNTVPSLWNKKVTSADSVGVTQSVWYNAFVVTTSKTDISDKNKRHPGLMPWCLFWWTRWDSTRATAVAWSLAVTTVHRTVALCRSSFKSHWKQKVITAKAVITFLVDPVGFEPMTSRMRTERSPNWATGPCAIQIIFLFFVCVNKKLCRFPQSYALICSICRKEKYSLAYFGD